ncbi:MAG TPA: NAD(P)/FAD-dependent oxidoreductase [Chitinophagaceae bacterium]|nr:NAD(P)/FAD-dependent oxidoreductase [Chitinophagaceae bacterium]
MEKENIIIVGAGAAGLMAAKELADKYNVTVLEASQRTGGRIRSLQTQHSPGIIEAGAEFIHGHQKQTIQLLDQAGVQYIPVEGKMYRKEKGSWEEQTEMVEGWDQLLKQMKKIKQDIPLQDFLDTYFSDNDKADLRRHAIAFTEGFDLADIKKVSVKSLYDEWSNEEEENFRIPAGYGALIHFLEDACEKKGCRILTNHTVKQIDWEKNEVTVYTDTGEKYYGNKLICTVPLKILVKASGRASINFTPPIDEYIKAGDEIGTGAVVKVVLLFRDRFWKNDTGFIFSDEFFPTWWTQLPDTRPVLTGWVGGPKAAQLSDQSEEQILEKAILSLASIFENQYHEVKNSIEEAIVFNWQQEETTLYGYSYNTLQTPAARQLLNTPIDSTIFFAGEGVYEGVSPGTVEAALVSGKQAAAKLSERGSGVINKILKKL